MHTQTAGGFASVAPAALNALLDGHYDHAEELLNDLPPALLRRLALAARELARLARDAALCPYLGSDEIAAWGGK